MKTTEMDTEAAVNRDSEEARADARGMVFLVGMLVAGGVAIAATLAVGTPSGTEASPGSAGTTVTAR